MSWLQKLLPKKKTGSDGSHAIPEGLWLKCPSCETIIYKNELQDNLYVCTNCDFHHRISARVRLNLFLDADKKEIAHSVISADPLRFKDSRRYTERVRTARKQTDVSDALIVYKGTVKQIPVVAAAFEFDFIGGSMGSAVGERFSRAVDAAIAQKSAFVCFTASGGARMQEGLLSLMQMAKTNASLTKLAQKGLPFISVLTDPTLGGVSASFAFIGDVVIAEPNALIGFAGPRVIATTVRQELPEGFQRSEFLLHKGAIDMICQRKELRDSIANIIAIMQKKPQLQ